MIIITLHSSSNLDFSPPGRTEPVSPAAIALRAVEKVRCVVSGRIARMTEARMLVAGVELRQEKWEMEGGVEAHDHSPVISYEDEGPWLRPRSRDGQHRLPSVPTEPEHQQA